MSPDPPIRVTDAEREQAVERLQQAFADGRLSAAEVEERLERALTARHDDDLTPLLADLRDAAAGEVVEISGGGGRIVRRGGWRVPRALRVESGYGSVVLDLSDAIIEHPSVDIELRLAYGSAVITVPASADVDVDGVVSEWGRVVCRHPRGRRPGGPRIRVTGTLGYGRLKVRFKSG